MFNGDDLCDSDRFCRVHVDNHIVLRIYYFVLLGLHWNRARKAIQLKDAATFSHVLCNLYHIYVASNHHQVAIQCLRYRWTNCTLDPQLLEAITDHECPSLSATAGGDVGNGLVFMVEKLNLALNPKTKGLDRSDFLSTYCWTLNATQPVEQFLNKWMKLGMDEENESKKAMETNSDRVYNYLMEAVGRTPYQACAHGRTNPLTGQDAEQDRPWPWEKMERSTSNRAAHQDATLKMVHQYRCRLNPNGQRPEANAMQQFNMPD